MTAETHLSGPKVEERTVGIDLKKMAKIKKKGKELSSKTVTHDIDV